MFKSLFNSKLIKYLLHIVMQSDWENFYSHCTTNSLFIQTEW